MRLNGKKMMQKTLKTLLVLALCASASLMPTRAQAADLLVSLNRSSLVMLPSDMSEVVVANPDIADVHAHGTLALSVIAKKLGQTNINVFDRQGKLMRSINVVVGYDLPAIRKALKNFLPGENIGVEMVHANVALTGDVSSASAADRAVKIVSDFVNDGKQITTGADQVGQTPPGILNLLQITSSQQVMLRVRVGEIQREALKRLGVDPGATTSPGNFVYQLGVGNAISSLAAGATADFSISDGAYHGISELAYQNGNTRIFGVLQALERDGLFKVLAEPNLTAISGEEAEFLAGGEIPIPVVQGGGSSSSSSNSVSIEYKPFGVAVSFTPFVLSENRIRMSVQPEVSEISTVNSVQISGFNIPSISTRRAKTTIELAPGESFMVAGLIKDQSRATITQLPGVKELPILGALFRSTEFQRNETELVIAVTPYLVDPVKSSDIRLPTDNFVPASDMEMFFYGALGGLTGRDVTPSAEGRVGFMVD